MQGKGSEWALLKRHSSEDIFGVQIASGHPDQYTRIAEVLANESLDIDFVDMNLGCPSEHKCIHDVALLIISTTDAYVMNFRLMFLDAFLHCVWSNS